MIRTNMSGEAIDVGAEIVEISKDSQGAVVTFQGKTRATGTHGTVVALEYESYLRVAESQLRTLTSQAAQRWPVENILALHRTGTVKVGETSVLVAVSSPHRKEAFDACQWLIDTIKTEVAIWKRELYEDGSSKWAGTL